MKIRNGFVSNSSSSSFIISTEHFKSVRELATYMIKKQIEEFDDDSEEWQDSYRIRIKRLNNIEENQAVSFPSCNYDTYIRKVGNAFFVSTCNNTNWHLWNYSLNKLPNETIEELKKMANDPFYAKNDKYQQINTILEGDINDFSRFGIDFYDLNMEIIGVETYDDCPKDHGHYLWNTVKYGKICPKCNPYYKRREKLEQIEKLTETEE